MRGDSLLMIKQAYPFCFRRRGVGFFFSFFFFGAASLSASLLVKVIKKFSTAFSRRETKKSYMGITSRFFDMEIVPVKKRCVARSQYCSRCRFCLCNPLLNVPCHQYGCHAICSNMPHASAWSSLIRRYSMRRTALIQQKS